MSSSISILFPKKKNKVTADKWKQEGYFDYSIKF